MDQIDRRTVSRVPDPLLWSDLHPGVRLAGRAACEGAPRRRGPGAAQPPVLHRTAPALVGGHGGRPR